MMTDTIMLNRSILFLFCGVVFCGFLAAVSMEAHLLPGGGAGELIHSINYSTRPQLDLHSQLAESQFPLAFSLCHILYQAYVQTADISTG